MVKCNKKAISFVCILVMIVQMLSPVSSIVAFAETEGITNEVNMAAKEGETSENYEKPQTPSVVYNMNIDWKYKRAADGNIFPYAAARTGVAKDGKQFYEVGYDDSDWETVSVPHAINAEDSFDGVGVDAGEASLYRGFMFYRKTFTVPQTDAGKKFFLEFEAFRQSIYVYVNGEMVGFYEAGVAAVGFDITKYIKAGEENLIAVATDNTSSRGSSENTQETILGHEPGDLSGIGYQWNCKDFNEIQGGLTGNVYLYAKGQVYQTLPLYNNLKTKGNYIYASNFDFRENSADISVEAEVRNEAGEAKDITLEVNVVDGDGKLVASFEKTQQVQAAADIDSAQFLSMVPETAYNEKGEGVETGKADTSTIDVSYITAMQKVEGLHFWSDESPYLYTVYTILKQGDEVIDLCETTTGFREVTYDKDKGLMINGVSTYLTGYAQRSTNEWAAIGVANDWISDVDMQLIKESNANMIRWMHIAPNPVDIRAGDKYGVISICPAGDKEGDQTGRSWDQRLETMRDVMIYYRNSPSILFWEAGNNAVSAEHMKQMTDLRKELDPTGNRFMGCRSIQSKEQVKEAEWVGTMVNRYDANAYAAMQATNHYVPMIETEYHRNESPRRSWDDYTPPDYDYVNKWLGSGGSKTDGYDVWDQTQEDFARTMASEYSYFYNNRVGGTGNNYYSGAALMVWSDSNMHVRNCGVENCRTSGRVDAVRIKKESFYAIQAVQAKNAVVKIMGHWNYPSYIAGDKENGNYWYEDKTFNGTFWEGNGTLLQRDPTQKTVYVIASPFVSKVELYINDTLVSSSDKPDSNCIYTFRNIDVTQSGKITAKAYNSRDEVAAEDEIVTAGKAATIQLKPVTGPEGFLADGADIMYVDVEVVDENGNICLIDERKINFTVNDAAKAVFLGGYNSGVGERIVNHKDYVYAECGVNRVFLRSTREAGSFTLTASAEGIQPVSVTLNSKEVALEGGITTVLPQAFAQGEVPEIVPPETAPALKTLGSAFTADFGENGNVYTASDDTRDYYSVTINGTPVVFTDKPYKPDGAGVVAEITPILEALKTADVDLTYTYATEGSLPAYFGSEGGVLPYLKITAGDIKIELANVATVVFTNEERSLTNFGVMENSAKTTLIAELTEVIGKIPGLEIQVDSENKVFAIIPVDQTEAKLMTKRQFSTDMQTLYAEAENTIFTVEQLEEPQEAADIPIVTALGQYDEVASENLCNEVYDAFSLSEDTSPDGTKYLINQSGNEISMSGLDADSKADLLWEADVRFDADGSGISPKNKARNYGTCIRRHGTQLAIETGSKKYTDYFELDAAKWYHIELVGRYSASDAKIDMTVYEYNGTEKVLKGTWEGVNLRNLSANNKSGAQYWSVMSGTSVDNMKITRIAADELKITAQDEEDIIEVTAGNQAQFKCSATRQGAYITAPAVTWALYQEDGETLLQDEYITITQQGLLMIDAKATQQTICIKASAETGVFAAKTIKINAINLDNVKFDVLNLTAEKNVVTAGETLTIQAAAEKNGQSIALTEDDLIWYVCDKDNMRKIGENPKWISVDKGVVSIDQRAISQDITIRAADTTDSVRGAIQIHIKSSKVLEEGEEGTKDILLFADNCETTKAKTEFAASIDGTSAYKVTETHPTGEIADTNSDVVIEMDIQFAGEGAGFTPRNSGSWNTCLEYHGGRLAVKTGSSSYTYFSEAGEITTEDWYHITLIRKQGSYAHLIVDAYNENGEIDTTKRKTIKDVNQRNDKSMSFVEMNAGTIYDNLQVLNPTPTEILVSTDVTQVFAGNTLQVSSQLLWNGLEMKNPDASTFEYKLYDFENKYPLENDKIKIDASGLVSIDATVDAQDVYIRAISKKSGIYESTKFSIISSDIFAVTGIGINEDLSKIVNIKVNKDFYYNDEVTFITEIFDENGLVKAVKTRQLYGESLRTGENTVAIGMDIPADFDKEKDKIQVYVITKLDTNAATTENSEGASVEIRENNAYITVPSYDAGSDVAVLILERDTNEKKVQDSNIIYFNQVKAEEVGNAIPVGSLEKCIAKTGGKVNAQLVVQAALLGEASIPSQVDKTELQEAIQKAEGIKESEYTAESYKVLKDALEAAKKVSEDKDATQEEVNSAEKALSEAIKALKKEETPTPGTTDKTKLQEAIQKAEGLKETEYTAESYKVLKDALEAAKKVSENKDVTQEEVNSAEKALSEAIKALKKAEVVKPVESVTLSSSELNIIVGKTAVLNAVIAPEDAADKTLIWKSNNESIATVEDGEVIAVKVGEITITISSANGKSASCIVTVKAGISDVVDSTENWQYAPIEYVYLKGMMTGKGTDENGNITFAPNANLTREEFAQILYAAEGKPEVEYTDRFTDVPEGKWYTNAILWAESKGIVSGYATGKYGVGDKITREQLALMIYKYAEYKEYDVTKTTSLEKFKDIEKVSGWAKTSLEWANANGVISGKGENLDPLGQATRAECAAMLRSFMVKFTK